MNSVRAGALVCLCAGSTLRAESKPESTSAEQLSCLPAAKPFFERAWEAWSNVHTDEARELFAQTLAIDPACVLAWAHLGALTPGADGRLLVDGAAAGSAALSAPERLQVLALAAQHRGDDELALALSRSALRADGRSYRLTFMVARRARALRRWSEMLPAALRATELEPARSAAWNQLGAAYLGRGQNEQAVATLKHAADLAPMEANAHDSLGDALLANNQLDEARAAYQRAIDSSGGSFWPSWQGVATVCALQADWFCARTAIENAQRSAPLQDDRLALMAWTAWSFLAEAQPGEAYRAVDELEQDAGRLGGWASRRAWSTRGCCGGNCSCPRAAFAIGQKDLPAAIASFKKCSEAFDACKLHLAEAQDLAGQTLAAQKTRSLVGVSNHRDPAYWWAHVHATELKMAPNEDRSAF